MKFPLHRFTALATLSAGDINFFESLGEPAVLHHRGDTLRREGEPSHGIYLLLDGWVTSSTMLRSGARLIQKVHLPGDILGTPSMALRKAADTLTAVTEVTTSSVSARAVGTMLAEHPRAAAMFLMAAQLERVALMDTLAIVGKASAAERVVRLLLDLYNRLGACGLVKDDSFELPLMQEMMGDLIGITSVHMNRTLRSLERDGLIVRVGHRLYLRDMQALRSLSPIAPREPRFDPDWMPGGG